MWDLLLTRGPALGLHLNPSKCEWSWLDPACKDACPIRLDGVSEENQAKLVPHEHIQMLGEGKNQSIDLWSLKTLKLRLTCCV